MRSEFGKFYTQSLRGVIFHIKTSPSKVASVCVCVCESERECVVCVCLSESVNMSLLLRLVFEGLIYESAFVVVSVC